MLLDSHPRLMIRNVSFFSSWENAMPFFFSLIIFLSFVDINFSVAKRENGAKKAKLELASTFLQTIFLLPYFSVLNY